MTDKDIEEVFASYGQFVTGKDYALVRAIAAVVAQQRTWVGLTDVEILSLIGIHVDDINDIDDWQEEIREVRAIEAKLKEKNA